MEHDTGGPDEHVILFIKMKIDYAAAVLGRGLDKSASLLVFTDYASAVGMALKKLAKYAGHIRLDYEFDVYINSSGEILAPIRINSNGKYLINDLASQILSEYGETYFCAVLTSTYEIKLSPNLIGKIPYIATENDLIDFLSGKCEDPFSLVSSIMIACGFARGNEFFGYGDTVIEQLACVAFWSMFSRCGFTNAGQVIF